MYDLLSAYFTNRVIRMLHNGICVFKSVLVGQDADPMKKKTAFLGRTKTEVRKMRKTSVG